MRGAFSKVTTEILWHPKDESAVRSHYNCTYIGWLKWIRVSPGEETWNCRFLQRLASRLSQLNFFGTKPPSTDPDKLRSQFISTRIFILLFMISLIALLIYTATVTHITTIVVKNPDLQKYNDLLLQHAQTLSCPCTQISTRFDSFIHINHLLHHICTSFYVTDEWIGYIRGTDTTLWNFDFRFVGVQLFQGLRSFCQLAEEFFQTSLMQFYSNHYVSALAMSNAFLQSQARTIVDQFISSTINSFVLSLRTIGNTTQANALLSALTTNYFLKIENGTNFINVQEIDYRDNCHCSHSSACINLVPVFDPFPAITGWVVPGFYSGCFIVEALRQSRIECLYNQTCLDELQVRLRSKTSLDIVALDPSMSERYHPTTPIGVMVDALMVEEWNWTIEHDKYYGVCKPAECSYTMITRNGVITIMTTLVGLIGGLVTALRLMVSRLVLAIRWMRKRRTARVFISGRLNNRIRRN